MSQKNIYVKEPSSLHGLLMDYIEVLDNLRYDESQTKTSTIKELIKSKPQYKGKI